MKIALFPGSFDPFTRGHQAIVERALPMFDKLVIAIGVNRAKKGWMPIEERLERLRMLYANEPRVEVVAYETLTMDLAEQYGAKYILRGVRSVTDFEDFACFSFLTLKYINHMLIHILRVSLPYLESLSVFPFQCLPFYCL